MDGPKGGGGGGGSNNARSDSTSQRESPPKSDNLAGSIQPTNDPVRNKCREMIFNSLNVEPEKVNIQFVSLMAAKVEGKITIGTGRTRTTSWKIV